MGACCVLERLPDEAATDDNCPRHGYNSVLFQQDSASTSVGCQVVYRPPCLNKRLIPGEAKPQFWINPYSMSRDAAVVSVAWGKTPQESSSYCQYFPRSRKSKRSSKHGSSHTNACIRGGEMEQNHLSEITGTKPTMDSGDNNLHIKTYPDFLLPFVNKVVRLRLVCLDYKMSQLVGAYSHLKQGMHTDPSAEMSHLVRNMHSLRLHLTYNRDIRGLPSICVEEHHGGIKRLRKIRYRAMPVKWIDMDHRKPAIQVTGDSFILNLEPPTRNLSLDDYPEGNGELPSAIGIYIRNLDTAADTKIKFSVSLYRHNNNSQSSQNYQQLNEAHDCFVEKDTFH